MQIHRSGVTEVERVLRDYPRIFFACHERHRVEPQSKKAISAHQASILDHLDAREPVGLKDLARHMGVTPATMSVGIDRLVRGGWVKRERDAGDGRKINLTLTAAGERMKE